MATICSWLWQEPPKFCLMRNWWETNKLGLTALAIAVGPSLLVSTTNPDSFSAATDIAVSKQK